MICETCHYPVDPGQEIRIDGVSDNWLHCPYCVGVLAQKTRFGADRIEVQSRELSIWCFMERRKVRERLVDKLTSDAKGARCSMCHQPLSENDLLMIRHTEAFRCPGCGHDLSDAAYREEAYSEHRWLSVIPAIQDRMGECGQCCYLGAMARACLDAYSRMSVTSKQEGLLKLLLEGKDWSPPETDCYSSCNAVHQYIALPGAGMVLLSKQPD